MHRKNIGLLTLGFALAPMITGCGDDTEDPPAGPPPAGVIAFEAKKVGSPSWEIVDYHMFSGTMSPDGVDWDPYYETIKDTLPSPEHTWIEELGVGPGEAHAGPYDSELGDHLASRGHEDAFKFKEADVVLPNGFYQAMMVVPSAGSPTGSSPDSESGPIIPHTLFPISVESSFYNGDVEDPDLASGGFVPALDALEMPFEVDGHSHFPLFYAMFLDPEDALGEHRREYRIIDAKGNGWEIEAGFIVEP